MKRLTPWQRINLTAAQRRRLHLPGRGLQVAADREIKRFVDRCLDTMTFAEIAQACREKFGAARAPSEKAVTRYWNALQAAKLKGQPAVKRNRRLQQINLTEARRRRLHLPGRRSKIARNPDIKRFVDRSLATKGYVEIAQACREKFGAARAPSKSAVGRYQRARHTSKRRGKA